MTALVPFRGDLSALSVPVDMPKDLGPRVMLNQGDAIIWNDNWWAYVRSDALYVYLQQAAGPQVERPFTHAQIRQLLFDRDNPARIKRHAYRSLPPEIARDMHLPLTGFLPRDVDEALMRLDYVAAMTRALKSKTVSMTKKGYGRIARIVAWMRRRKKATELSEKKGRHVRPRDLALETWAWNTVRSWFWRWEASSGLLAALAPRHRNKGAKDQRLHPVVRRLINDYVWKHWMTLQKLSLPWVHDALCSEIRRINAELPEPDRYAEPDIRSVWRWIDRHFTDQEICWYREGAKVARERYRNVKKAPVGLHQLHTVQIDYTQLDAFVVDEKGRPMSREGTANTARPYIVAAVCTLTNMIVGWHVTMDPPSWDSVMACLRHMILPKDVSGIAGLQSPYPCMGVCDVLKMDNEPCFRSRSMVLTTTALRIQPDWGPSAQSRIRGKIERFFREVGHNSLAPVPGRSFSNPRERGEVDSQGLARFTLPELIRWLSIWILDVYHNRPHAANLWMTPLEKWEATLPLEARMPDSLEDLDAVLAFGTERTIQREGVRFFGLRYQCSHFTTMLGRRRGRGVEYVFKVDPNDLTVAALYDDVEEKWYYPACTTPELVEGLSLLQWREACKLRHRLAKSGKSRATMQDAIRMLLEEAAEKGSMREVRRFQPEDDTWFRANETNTIFDMELEDGSYSIKEANRADNRMRGKIPELADPEVLDDSGPVVLPEVEIDDGEIIELPEVDVEIENGEPGIPQVVEPAQPAAEADAPARVAQNIKARGSLELHDPASWGDDDW